MFRYIFILIMPLFLFSCSAYDDSLAEGRAKRAKKATGDIVIGAVGTLKEEYALLMQGVDMAVDEINSNGGLLNGRKLKIIAEDDQHSVDTGQVIAQRFAENLDMVAVIGHATSFISVPTSIMYQYYGLVMLSPLSTSNKLTEQGYSKIFRNIPNNALFGRKQAEFCSQKGFSRILIYHLKDDYAQDLSNAFEIYADELGLTIVDRLSYDSFSNTRHFRRDLKYWQDTFDFDAIFLAGLMPQVAKVVVEAKKIGITVPIIGSDALNTPALFTEAGSYAEGVYTTSIYHPTITLAANKIFVRKYLKKHGQLAGIEVAQGYEAVHVLATAITQAESTVPGKIAAALHHLENYTGITGAYFFDENGDVKKRKVFMLVVKNGTFQLVKK